MNENYFSIRKFRSLGLLALFALVACGPTVKLSPLAASQKFHSVAIFPPTFPEAVQREKVLFIHKALASELQSAGFSVLDERIVTQVCLTPECPDFRVLAERYGVDGYVRLSMESTTRANFVAGYYNAVAGRLELLNRELQQVAEVEHTESDRGGVVFNSGQLIQGVISQVKSGSAEAQNDLASKFARTIVSKLPNADKGVSSDQLEENLVEIRSASLKPLRRPAYEICVDATPASMAALILDRRKFLLREISPGHYCGAYRADEIASRELGVEVRSPYGAAVRQVVNGPKIESCDLEGRLRAETEAKGARLIFECLQLGDDSKSVVGTCPEAPRRCGTPKFIIYRAPAEEGPFLRVAETTGTIWNDRMVGVTPSTVYGVIALDQSGTISRPVSARFIAPADVKGAEISNAQGVK